MLSSQGTESIDVTYAFRVLTVMKRKTVIVKRTTARGRNGQSAVGSEERGNFIGLEGIRKGYLEEGTSEMLSEF